MFVFMKSIEADVEYQTKNITKSNLDGWKNNKALQANIKRFTHFSAA